MSNRQIKPPTLEVLGEGEGTPVGAGIVDQGLPGDESFVLTQQA